MVIYDVKKDTNIDSILQNCSQEPSTSSKNDCVLDELLFMQGSWNLEYKTGMRNNIDSQWKIWYQWWSNPPKLQPGTINILQVLLCSWCTYNHAREMKIWIQLRNDKVCLCMMSNLVSEMIQFSKNPVKNY